MNEKQARQRAEALRKELLKKERSRPREEIPSAYAGETIHIHKRIYDAFNKQAGRKIDIESMKVEGGIGGKLIVRYMTKRGGRGTIELYDLGPMPV